MRGRDPSRPRGTPSAAGNANPTRARRDAKTGGCVGSCHMWLSRLSMGQGILVAHRQRVVPVSRELTSACHGQWTALCYTIIIHPSLDEDGSPMAFWYTLLSLAHSLSIPYLGNNVNVFCPRTLGATERSRPRFSVDDSVSANAGGRRR